MEANSSSPDPLFEELYRSHARLVKSTAMQILHNSADADDAVQMVFFRAWLHPLLLDEYCERWLTIVARNVARDLLRGRTRDRARKDEYFRVAATFDNACDPEAIALQHIESDALWQALSNLPAVQRRPLIATYYTGASHTLIAHTDSIPLGTVKTRIRSGISALRKGKRIFSYAGGTTN